MLAMFRNLICKTRHGAIRILAGATVPPTVAGVTEAAGAMVVDLEMVAGSMDSKRCVFMENGENPPTSIIKSVRELQFL